jgi:hypothetical protein
MFPLSQSKTTVVIGTVVSRIGLGLADFDKPGLIESAAEPVFESESAGPDPVFRGPQDNKKKINNKGKHCFIKYISMLFRSFLFRTGPKLQRFKGCHHGREMNR